MTFFAITKTFLLMVMTTTTLNIQEAKCSSALDVSSDDSLPLVANVVKRDDDRRGGDAAAATTGSSCGLHVEAAVQRMLERCTAHMWRSLGLQPQASIVSRCLVPGQIIDAQVAAMLAAACQNETGSEAKRCDSSSDDSSSSSSDSSDLCDDTRSTDSSSIGSTDSSHDNNSDDSDDSIAVNATSVPGRSVSSDSSDSHDDNDSRRQGRSKRSLASSLSAYRWNPPLIVYWFGLEQSGAIDAERVKTEVRRAMAVIQSETCIRFSESFSGAQLVFYTSSSCASNTGRRLNNAGNSVFLGPECQYSAGQVLHLLLQTLGFFNEHQRTDRDEYLTVRASNVDPTRLDALIALPESLATTFGLPYDYHSLMQQPQKFLSSNGGATLEAKDPLHRFGLGQRVELSFVDKVALNKMYCSGQCAYWPVPPCANGGIQFPNSCDRCTCPDGFAGIYCQDFQPHSTPECGANAIDLTTTQTAILQSPGYDAPRYYSSGVSCTWIARASPGSTITVSFAGDFGVFCKDSSSCQHWVEIRQKKPLYNDGPRFCCNNRPTADVTSEDNEMLILFRTNDIDGLAGTNRGFRLNLRGQSTTDPPVSILGILGSFGSLHLYQMNTISEIQIFPKSYF